MILTPGDKVSGLWRQLTEHWTARIEALRTRLEGDITEAEAAKLRGRIAELRANLALSNEVPAAPE